MNSKGKIIMGLFDFVKKKEEVLDDISFIREMRCYRESWIQYDFLLAASGYGWDYMVGSADYMSMADLDNIGTISVSPIAGGEAREYIEAYKASGYSIKDMDVLKNEAGALGVGGISRVVKAPVKIVWFNQTRTLRIFSPVDDEDLFLRYAETVIRRTFGTDAAMKKYKPVPKQ